MGYTSDHEKLIGIPSTHSLRATTFRNEQRKGRDSDIYIYEEVDKSGRVVASYEVREDMSIYPPFSVTKTWRKFDGK
jgi:hypothetical protein